MNDMQRMVFDEDHIREMSEKRKVEMEKNIEKIFEKLSIISKEIGDINVMCPIYGEILFEFYEKSVNLMEKVSNEKIEKFSDVNDEDRINVTDKIKVLSDIINFPIENFLNDLIREKIDEIQKNQQTNFDKEVDKETLEFITSNSKMNDIEINVDLEIDDYENFLKQNSVKENLNFLSKNI